MFYHLFNIISVLDISIEHAANQIDTLVTHCERDTQIPVHDFIDAVERVLFVNDGVQEDAQCPDILFLASIRSTSQHFGSSIIF